VEASAARRGSLARAMHGAARHGPIGLALAHVPEPERANAVVSRAHGKR
jgi:hypothetical protein